MKQAQLINDPLLQQETLEILAQVGGLGPTGLLLLHTAREAGATLIVDEEGITRRVCVPGDGRHLLRPRVFGVVQSDWVQGQGRQVRELLDLPLEGRKLAIPSLLVAGGPRLLARLKSRLALLLKVELRDLVQHGGRFRPSGAAGVVLLTCITPKSLTVGLTAFDRACAGWTQPAAGCK